MRIFTLTLVFGKAHTGGTSATRGASILSIVYRTGAHNEARDIVYQVCKIAFMDVDHDPPGLYKEVGKRPADLLIHGADFDRTAVDFSITEAAAAGAAIDAAAENATAGDAAEENAAAVRGRAQARLTHKSGDKAGSVDAGCTQATSRVQRKHQIQEERRRRSEHIRLEKLRELGQVGTTESSQCQQRRHHQQKSVVPAGSRDVYMQEAAAPWGGDDMAD